MGGLFSSPSNEAYDSESPAAKYIQGITHDKCVVVFSKTHCPFCRKVKGILDGYSANYETVELDQRSDGKDLQHVLGQLTGASTVSWLLGQFMCK